MSEKKLTQYRRKHLGYVFQMYNLIANLMVKENIEVDVYKRQGRFRPIHYTLYFVIGWSAIMFIPDWFRNDKPLLGWICLLYTSRCV